MGKTVIVEEAVTIEWDSQVVSHNASEDSRDVQGGLYQNPPVVENFGKPPPCPAKPNSPSSRGANF